MIDADLVALLERLVDALFILARGKDKTRTEPHLEEASDLLEKLRGKIGDA